VIALFSVTLDVLHHGCSHGTITEVVEADTAQEAETKLVARARDMLPSNRSVRPLLTVEARTRTSTVIVLDPARLRPPA
jgi:hypothetical protein